MLKPHERAVVRIYSKTGGVVVGAGFLVFQRYILTCTHVVADALGIKRISNEIPTDEVILDFPRVAPRQKLRARVVFWQPVDPSKEKEEEDITGLELIDPSPDEAQPARLLDRDTFSENEFEAFGFPAGNHNGTWAYGVLRGRTANGRIQIEDVKQPGYRLEPGFSGTPVWDKKLEGVVGIAVSADPKRPEAKVAFIIPADVLIKAWSQLSPQRKICPYQSLSAFREEDAQFFFGRDRFRAELLEAVEKKQLITVIGSSGSGKSSLVFAGLIPNLLKQGNWLIDSFRPSEDPLFELIKASIRLLQPGTEEVSQIDFAVKWKQEFQASRLSIQQIIGSILGKNPGKKLLIVVDQFEELYTRCKDEKQQQLFLDQLLAGVRYTTNFTVVLTLRADFLGYALSYRPFADAIPEADQMLSPMNLEELREAIEKPIENLAMIESGLTERILEDIKQEPGNLPLLEFTLTLLWEKKKYGWLTHRTYDEIGGVGKALAQYAEEEYQKLSVKDQQRAKQVLIQLVRPGDETQDTRRLATRSEVGYDNWDLVTRLADKRLVVAGRDASTGEEIVEVVHEALIREWDSLQRWINTERSFRLWQDRLQALYRKWRDANQHEDALLQGINVAEADGWLQRRIEEISPRQQNFIKQSIKLRDRKRRRIFYAMVTVSITVSVLGVIALLSRQAAVAALGNQINALSRSSLVLRNSGQPFDALLSAMRAGRPIMAGQIRLNPEDETWKQVHKALQWSMFYVREQNRLEGHADEVWSVSFSPDGQLIATASSDETVKLWSRKGQELTTLIGHKGIVASVSFSPDSQIIATASFDKTIKLWNREGQEIRTIEGHEGWIYSVSFSPDGRTIASASKDGTARLWNQNGSPSRIFRVPASADKSDGGFNAVTFSPDGRKIAASSWDRTVKLWDLENGQEQTFRGHEDAVNSVNFSPDGNMLVTGSRDQTIKFWGLDGRILKTLKGHTGEVSSVSFSPDGKTIVSAGFDKTVRLWDLNGEELKPSLTGHNAQVNQAAFSPDGSTIASAGFDKTAKLWAHTHQEFLRFNGHKIEGQDNNLWGISFSPDGQTIATASQDNTVKLWSRGGQEIKTLKGHSDTVTSVKFSSDDTMIATTSKDDTVMLWSRDGIRIKVINKYERSDSNVVDSLSFSPNSQIIATADWLGNVKIWNRDGTEFRTFKAHGDRIYDINFSPNGQMIATASRDKTVKLWNLDGQLVKTLEGHSDQIYNASFSSDGNTIITSSRDNTIKLWNLDGQNIKTIDVSPVYSGQVYSAKLSSNGKLIVAATRDGRITIWNLNGDLLKILDAHTDIIDDVSFSPDGKSIASASRDDTAIIFTLDFEQLEQSETLWGLDLDKVMKDSCTWAGDYLQNNIDISKSGKHICN